MFKKIDFFCYSTFTFANDRLFLLARSLVYPFTIANSKFTFATKNNTDAIQTCIYVSQPNISRVNAIPNHVTIAIPKLANAMYIRFVFQHIRVEHNGNRHIYHVKYCAVITLLNVTNVYVCMKIANVISYGAMPKLA